MTTNEYEVELDTQASSDRARLFITDPSVLIRPAVPGQYHSVKHDTARAYSILELGNSEDEYAWNIIYRDDPSAAHRLLDRVFYAFVDTACFELWCDASVNYIVNGKTVMCKEYGFEDGQYTMIFNVHCSVPPKETEAKLLELLRKLPRDQYINYIVVRPDAFIDGDFNARGFAGYMTIDLGLESAS
jgi:hypothetical protein